LYLFIKQDLSLNKNQGTLTEGEGSMQLTSCTVDPLYSLPPRTN
jgi:hypothetical protein